MDRLRAPREIARSPHPTCSATSTHFPGDNACPPAAAPPPPPSCIRAARRRNSSSSPAPRRLSCTPADGDKASRDCCTQVQGAERSARAIHSFLQQRLGHHVLPQPSPGRKTFAPAHPRQWLRIGPSTREKQRRAPSRGER